MVLNMIPCYAIKQSDGSYKAPFNLMGRYNGVGGFHLLTDEEREQYNWFRCELYNESYNELIESRTNEPECVWDDDKHCIIATYTIVPYPLNYVIETKCDQVDKLLKQKIYTDIEVMFPDGPKVVQFRNDQDRLNLSNVTQAAIALVVSGDMNCAMNYRTLDNITQEVTSQQMIQIGTYILGQKQNLVNMAWSHKDNLRLLTTVQEVVDYDITIE